MRARQRKNKEAEIKRDFEENGNRKTLSYQFIRYLMDNHLSHRAGTNRAGGRESESGESIYIRGKKGKSIHIRGGKRESQIRPAQSRGLGGSGKDGDWGKPLGGSRVDKASEWFGKVSKESGRPRRAFQLSLGRGNLNHFGARMRQMLTLTLEIVIVILDQ